MTSKQTPLIGVLAVQGDVREHLAAVTRVGGRAIAVRRPGELDSVDGLIIPGGESTTMDKLVRAFGLFEPLRRRIAEGMPVYGSCAGMIMLADRIQDGHHDQKTLGGIDMLVRRNAFGRQVDSFEADLPMPVLREPQRPLRAVFIRAPWVQDLGPDVDVLASIPDGTDRGRVVAVRQGNLVATAFHPEVSGDDRVHRYFTELVAEAANTAEATDTHDAARRHAREHPAAS